MKVFAGNSLAALAIVGIAIPAQAFAEVETTDSSPGVTDVALSAAGDLRGQVVQSSGRPVKNTLVQVSHNGAVIAEVKSDSHGRYTVKGLRSGLHVVRTSANQRACRFWTFQTAPVAAKKSLVMPVDSQAVRGQLLAGGVAPLLGASVVAGTAVAATVTTLGQEKFVLDAGSAEPPPASP